MIAANDVALLFLRRATADGQTVEGSDGNVLRATRLMRLFTEQLAAMAKLKGKTGQQKVVVEHVHVHSGGQAVVGAVASPTRSRSVQMSLNVPVFFKIRQRRTNFQLKLAAATRADARIFNKLARAFFALCPPPCPMLPLPQAPDFGNHVQQVDVDLHRSRHQTWP